MDIIWLLHDREKIGSRHQCIGLAEALGLPYIIKEVDIPNIYMLWPYTWYERASGSICAFENYELGKPWPQLIIASGRKSVAMAARLKKLSTHKTQVVVLQKPTQKCNDFDVILCPRHDQYDQAPHVIETTGSLHHLTIPRLSDARTSCVEPIGLVVMLGAPPQDQKTIHTMLQWLQGWERQAQHQNNTLHILASRRTPLKIISTLRDALTPQTRVWDPSSAHPNPYLTALAGARQIVVTGDSVNMLTESCFTGQPVYIWSLGRYRQKFQRFHQSLIDADHARWAEPTLVPFKALPLREIERVSTRVRALLGLDTHMVGAAGFEPTTLTPPA